MARSVMLPLRINARGGISYTPETDGGQRSLEQVIVARLLPGATQHPFDIAKGLTVPGATYDVARRGQQSLRGYVERMFAELEAEGRAQLMAFELDAVSSSGRRAAVIVWRNLERGGQQQTTALTV